jgi:hypothetical protein
MLKQATRVLALVTTLALAQLAQAAPVISPFAADLSASSYAADRAGGGSAQSAFNGGYWNAGTWGTHWIQADMGTSHTLSEVQFAIDVLPSTTTEQWIYLSDDTVFNSTGQFNLVAHRVGFTTQFQRFTLDFAPASGRYLLVVSNGGASWTAIGDGSPRTNWVDPGVGGGNGGNVPEPASLALVLGALGAAGAARLRSAKARATRA